MTADDAMAFLLNEAVGERTRDRAAVVAAEIGSLRARLAAQEPVVAAAAVLAGRWSRVWQPAPVNPGGLAAATEGVVDAYERMALADPAKAAEPEADELLLVRMPGRMSGRATIGHSRLPLTTILGYLRAGDSIELIADAHHPSLTLEQGRVIEALVAELDAPDYEDADIPAEPEQHRLDVWERDDNDWTWRCTCQVHGASWPSDRAAQEAADEHAREVAGTPAAEPAPDGWCCGAMLNAASLDCDRHRSTHECPDVLVLRDVREGGDYGLPVRDGGSSFVVIGYCPWCGAGLRALAGAGAPTEPADEPVRDVRVSEIRSGQDWLYDGGWVRVIDVEVRHPDDRVRITYEQDGDRECVAAYGFERAAIRGAP